MILHALGGGFVLLAPVPLAMKLVRAAAGPDAAGLGRDERWISLLLLYPVLQILIGWILGSTGLLATVPLLLIEAVALGAGLAWRGQGFGEWGIGRALSPVESTVLATLVVTGLIALVRCVVLPTGNFDSLAYHLPVMARWVSSGWLGIFEGLGQVGLYPSHHELFATVLVLPWYDDLAVALPNFLAWVHVGFAIRLLARRMGAGVDGAALAAGFFLLLPAVISRLDAIQPDLALAAVFLTVLAFLLRTETPPDRLDRMVVAAGIALLPGLKLPGLILLLILGAVVVLVARSSSGMRPLRGWKPDGRMEWAGLGVALLLAGSWYLRNLMALGNPFGEIEISLFGQTVFAGTLTREELASGSLQHVFRAGAAEDWRVLGGVLREWLSYGGLILLTGGVVAMFQARTRRRGAAAGVFLVLLVLYWTAPYGGDNGSHGGMLTPWMEVGLRYAFAPLAILAALAGSAMDRWRRVPGVLAIALAMIGAWTTVGLYFPTLLVRGVCLGVATVAGILLLRPPASVWPLRGFGMALVIAALLLSPLAADRRAAGRETSFGRVVEVLDSEVGEDEVIAAINTTELHLGSGRDWRRRVILPGLPSSAGDDMDRWLQGLREQGVTTLLLGYARKDAADQPAVSRIQKMIREPERKFQILLDYESLTRDLAVVRLPSQR